MKILNFAHPLTPAHLEAIGQITGHAAGGVLEVKAHFDPARPFADQARELVDGVGLSAEQRQTLPLLVNPPSLNVIACVLLAEVHGRAGDFPPVLRLRPVAGSVPPRFEVAEVVNLQDLRDQARQRR